MAPNFFLQFYSLTGIYVESKKSLEVKPDKPAPESQRENSSFCERKINFSAARLYGFVWCRLSLIQTYLRLRLLHENEKILLVEIDFIQ